MRIGIDIDGVLNDCEKFIIEKGGKYFYEKFGYSLIDVTQDDCTNKFGNGAALVNQNQEDEFWEKHISEFVILPAREHASEVINKLMAKGYEIFIITARTANLTYTEKYTKKSMQAAVVKFLKDNAINYHHLIFSGSSKVEACRENEIDIMIDDSVKHIESLSKFLKVVAYHSNYNAHCSGENIKRCFSWYDILCYIESLQL